MAVIDQVLRIVGGVVLGGGALVLLVYQAFKYLAARWLDARFAERLQSLRHQHDKELEDFRFKMSTLLDRTVKLHQREFEVLPEAWSKLNDGFWFVRSFVSPLQAYPDINRMSAPQQEDFIASSRLLEWQKEQVRAAEDKTKQYQELIFWHDLHEAQEKSRDAYTYLIRNGIFIDDEIRDKFNELHDLIWNALIEHKIDHEDRQPPLQRDQISKLTTGGESTMKELERMVHERLWPSGDTGL